MANRLFASIHRLTWNHRLYQSAPRLCLVRSQLNESANQPISTSARSHQQTHQQQHLDKATEHHERNIVLQPGKMPTSNELHFIEPSAVPQVPAYRVLNPDGVLEGELDPTLTNDKIISIYRQMWQLNTFDKIMYESQRQGRISFYMTNFGEEAVAFGTAAALDESDWIYAQYREAGILLYRGMPLRLMLAQCYGNKEDLGKGRQMPIHYGNRSLNFAPISSPLTVQLPQAAGTAYALKMQGAGKIVATYFGEGAASEGDAHAAMNFAATLACPMIFVCRNNGYAISTPANEQYVSDGIVHRGLGYGMSSVRVDGNDLFAVYAATRRAREICQRESRPCLIEAMTYRLGHHSTSDDSTAYRSADEVRQWEQQASPLRRLRRYLESNGLWSDHMEEECARVSRANVIEALNWAEKVKRSPVSTMFDDVYDELPANLRRQRDELKEHLEKYGQHYPLNEHEGF
jgi:2-oxoisovalerate dehydrogenase E1 component alpha subunit